jgi:hypothetical protein
VLSTTWSMAPVNGRARMSGSVTALIRAEANRSAQHPVGPVAEQAGARIDRCGQIRLVVQRGNGFTGGHQVLLAAVPVGGGQGRGQHRTEVAGAGQPGEGAAQPLGIRRIDPIEQQAQPHQAADDTPLSGVR